MTKHVVVIGAGIAGLATAALLLKEGMRVTVVDKQRGVGGRAGSLNVDGFRFDTGPSWYLMPEAFDEFFRACGTSTERELDLVDLSPAYRVYNEDGEFLDVETGVDEVARLFDSLEPGAGAKVRAYLARASEVYAVALRNFLYTTFSRPTQLLSKDVLTRLGTLAMLLTRSLDGLVAARFQDYRLRQILTYPAVFLSTEPKAAPALYSLMSHTDLVEGVRYPQGGFAAVVDAIARQAADATFELGTAVVAINHAHGRATGVTLDDGRTIPADAVVSAADLRHTETALLPRELQTYPERYFARRDPGLGTVLVFLGVKALFRSLHTTHCCSARTGRLIFGRSITVRRPPGRWALPSRSTCRRHLPPTPPSRRRATRTFSCSSQCQLRNPLAAAMPTAPRNLPG